VRNKCINRVMLLKAKDTGLRCGENMERPDSVCMVDTDNKV